MSLKRAANEGGEEEEEEQRKRSKAGGPSLTELGVDPMEALRQQRMGMLLRVEEQRREITELRRRLQELEGSKEEGEEKV